MFNKCKSNILQETENAWNKNSIITITDAWIDQINSKN